MKYFLVSVLVFGNLLDLNNFKQMLSLLEPIILLENEMNIFFGFLTLEIILLEPIKYVFTIKPKQKLYYSISYRKQKSIERVV